ncbi:MAG: metallophosphoesterase [Planctomycetota bacterium]|nr:metallophosphoesterase [Planctomycetota bacterium]
MTPTQDTTTLGRRAFLHDGTLFLLGTGLAGSAVSSMAAEQEAPRPQIDRTASEGRPTVSSMAVAQEAPRPQVRFGVVTDLHYADKESAGSRCYRETLTKLAEAADRCQQDRTDFVIELGDFIDAADSVEQERGYLERINAVFAALPCAKHYVLGNHCVYTLTKPEFLETVGRRDSYYSFDVGGYHFVVLDACFRQDGQPYGRQNAEWTDANIPAAELAWLHADLSKTSAKTIVFVHQCLDVGQPYGIKNAPEVRKILEASGQVLAVLQGHRHHSDYRELARIHYCTLVAMVDGSGPEKNGYALVDVLTDGTIRIKGFRQQPSHTL